MRLKYKHDRTVSFIDTFYSYDKPVKRNDNANDTLVILETPYEER